MIYDHNESQRVFGRIGGAESGCCMACPHWKADAVRAKIAKFLIDAWDGKTPEPPTPQDLHRLCCQSRELPAGAVTVDMSAAERRRGAQYGRR